MSGRLVRWLLAVAAPPRARAGATRLTIVRHHRVYADGEHALNRLGVAASVLEGQVAALAAAGLTPLTVAEGLERVRRGEAGHHVAFSFDDGYRDNVTRALPILQRHGARGTFYLTAGLMTERRAPWWDELTFVLERGPAEPIVLEWDGQRLALALGSSAGRAAALSTLLPHLRVPPDEQRRRLDALRRVAGVTEAAPCEFADWTGARAFVAAGMEVGAHTLTHPFLSLLPESAQRDEIAGSVAAIEARLGVRPAGLAYPNGDHDDRTARIARELALVYAVTTRAGDVVAGYDPFRILRRGLPDGACLAPGGRFSRRLTLAEVRGAFDHLRPRRAEAAS